MRHCTPDQLRDAQHAADAYNQLNVKRIAAAGAGASAGGAPGKGGRQSERMRAILEATGEVMQAVEAGGHASPPALAPPEIAGEGGGPVGNLAGLD